MLFSIVTPTWNRNDGRLYCCLNSVESQTGFSDWELEHIIIDDGSSDDTSDALERWTYDDYYECGSLFSGVKHKGIEHAGRVIARNYGMGQVEGDWVCWLDSDDCLDQFYLQTFASSIEKNPSVKLWVCGAVVHGMRNGTPIWTKLRPAWKPPMNENKRRKWIHADFPSGHIGTGMFMFHRSLLEKAWPMPDWRTHYEVADGIDKYLGYKTGYSGAKRWVGNPWGDDHAFFRKLTLYAEAHLVGEEEGVAPCLYIHYVREGN